MTATEGNAFERAGEASSRRIKDIEWLRAFAVLGVVVHHSQGNLFSWQPAWLTLFLDHFDLWSGVDIFFAISGFVIARNLLPRLGAGRHQLRSELRVMAAFWTARAFRLLPSAWMWLALALLASATFNASGVFGTSHTNLMAGIAGVLQVANFRLADAFDRYDYGVSFAYWSLSLEEQFYIILPLLILLTRRWIIPVLAVVIIAQALTTRGLLLVFLRTDALAWGVLLAWFSLRPGFIRALPVQRGWLRHVPRIIGFCTLMCIGLVSAIQSVLMGNRATVVAVLAALLVWIAAQDRNYFCGNDNFFRRFMLWCGSRSYAIYLIHVPTFFLVREFWFRITGNVASGGLLPTFFLIVTSALLISLFAELNFRVLEKPLRTIGKRLSERIAHTSQRVTAPLSMTET